MELLKKLTQTSAVSGIEAGVRDILIKELEGLGEISVSPMGNLTLHIKGNGEKAMFAAHMDEVGIMVTYVEDEGFLRFTQIGGLNAMQILGQRVLFENGTVGIVCYGEKAEKKDIKISSMFIDIGAENSEEAKKYVREGDCAAFVGSYITRGDYITSKALDDRVGCYILAEAAKRVKNNTRDLYFVFTVQEELGLRGAKTAAYDINPDFAVAVDVTATGDTPDGYKMAVSLGKGIAVKVRDNYIISHPKVKNMLTEAANKNGLEFQYEVLEFGGTDAGALQSSGGGVPSGVLSVPCRYSHTVNETIHKKDVEDAITVITQIANS